MSSSEPSVRPLALPELTPRPSPGAAGAGGHEAGVHAAREGQRIAHAIVARATARAREIQAAAQEEGHELGRLQALEREGAALRDAAAALAGAAERLDAARRDVHRLLEATLPELAVAVAARILRRELSLDPAILVGMIREALAVIGPAARISLRLHPADLAAVEGHRALLQDALGGADLRLEPAPEVGAGGCVIDTESLTLAAGLPQQLERALALLAEAPE